MSSSSGSNTNSPPQVHRTLARKRSGKLAQKASLQNLFVACLPVELSNGMLLELFAPFHPTTATVMLNMATGKSKGFGFVVFEKDEDGEAAMQHYADRSVTMDGITTGAFVMHISPSKFNGKTVTMESQYVFFRNIPSALHKPELRDYFRQYGSVLQVQQRKDEHSLDGSLLLLMVEFGSVDEAKYAIASCHQQVLFPSISGAPVMAKFADATTVKSQARKQHRGSPRHQTQQQLVGSGVMKAVEESKAHGGEDPGLHQGQPLVSPPPVNVEAGYTWASSGGSASCPGDSPSIWKYGAE